MKEKSEQSPRLPAIFRTKQLRAVSTAMVSVLIASACSGGEAQTVTDNSNNEPPGLALPFEGTGFLNSGPHNFRLKRDVPTKNEIASELDFAPKPVIKCEPGVRAIVTDWNITASESGKVTVVGDEKNELDSNHSIIQIKHPDGKSTRYTHVANIQVKKDQEIPKGQRLGNASCEYPPSGSTDGLHLDWSVLDANENPIDVRTITLSGWRIEGKLNYQGTMTKDGKTITADGRRCPVENPCDNGKIVNSITHGSSKAPNKAVLGAAAGPTRPGPINAAVGEKPIVAETPKPTPIPKPTERPMEQGWKTFRSINYPYEIQIPQNLQISTLAVSVFNKKAVDLFTGEKINNTPVQIAISMESTQKWVRPEDYAQNALGQVKQFNQNALLFTMESGEEPLYAGIKLKQKTFFIQYELPQITYLKAIFITNNQAWMFDMAMLMPQNSSEVVYRQKMNQNFLRMLTSFKPLQ